MINRTSIFCSGIYLHFYSCLCQEKRRGSVGSWLAARPWRGLPLLEPSQEKRWVVVTNHGPIQAIWRPYNLLFYQHNQCWFTLYLQYGIEGTDMQDWCLSCCCGACSEFQVKTHSLSCVNVRRCLRRFSRLLLR